MQSATQPDGDATSDVFGGKDPRAGDDEQPVTAAAPTLGTISPENVPKPVASTEEAGDDADDDDDDDDDDDEDETHDG